jgi:dihydroneopterin aldolase
MKSDDSNFAMGGRVHISELELFSNIGVPDAERAEPQRLTVHLTLFPAGDFASMQDEISNTVDYYKVTRRVRALAAERPRRLIETLAAEIVQVVLGEFNVVRVDVELRKYILPDTDYVAVMLTGNR